MAKQEDVSMLEAALVGYRSQAAVIHLKMLEIQQRLGKRGARGGQGERSTTGQQKKHRLSAEGRARISAAQRRRWAAAKADSGNSEAPAPAKRTISAAARKRMAAGQKKRYAAAKVKTAGAAAEA